MNTSRDQARRTVTFDPNPTGRDFVFGDIHGCFATVEAALDELDYDARRDRAFSLGDLIDYGTRSEDALEWMQSRFTATVRGNHEHMMLEWLWEGSRMHNSAFVWRSHWASWWFPMSRPREQRLAWFEALQRLPFAATVHTRGGARVGLMHGWGESGVAEGIDWDEECASLEERWEYDRPTALPGDAYSIMWSRPKVRQRRPTENLPIGMKGMELVLHGHDPGPEPGWTARRTLCIDTGVHWPELGHLTVAEIHTGEPKLHRFQRVDSLLEPEDENATHEERNAAFIAAMGTTEHPKTFRAEKVENT